MLAIDEAKLPPPKPAVAAIRQNTQYGVSGFCTAHANSSVGTSSSAALTIVQLRPPNLGTANVYGSRSSEPTRFGSATRKNSCCGVNEKPCARRNADETLQISQTEKPRCSAKIDQIRLRRATRRPVDSQNSGSSGRQSSIQRPVRAGRGAVVVCVMPPSKAAQVSARFGEATTGNVNLFSRPHNRSRSSYEIDRSPNRPFRPPHPACTPLTRGVPPSLR